jgi:retron-type reverse transcriptase
MKRNDKGTPQGGVISPLLANLYLHWFEKVLLRKIEHDQLRAGIVRYWRTQRPSGIVLPLMELEKTFI